MERLFKNKKALSPVVASIILIAVTVAMSIAIAAWMGAITFTFRKGAAVESITFGFESNQPSNIIAVNVQNTGSDTLAISEVMVNNMTKTFTGQSTLQFQENAALIIYNVGWISGQKYQVEILAKTNDRFSSKEVTAP